jgi:hypothetical protein
MISVECDSAEPIQGLIIQDNHSIIHPAPEKIVLDVFDNQILFYSPGVHHQILGDL